MRPIQRAVDASLVFDRAFTIEEDADRTNRLTTAALCNGRQVDVDAILPRHPDRGAWEPLEVRVGGAAVPVTGLAD